MQLSLFEDVTTKVQETYRPPLVRSPGMVDRIEVRLLNHADTGMVRAAVEWTDDATGELIGWWMGPQRRYHDGGREVIQDALERLWDWLRTAQEPF